MVLKKESKIKKIFKRAFYFLIICIILLFVLFSTLIINPFEYDFHNPLPSLSPHNTDFILHIKHPTHVISNLQKVVYSGALKRNSHVKMFFRSPLYRQINRNIPIEVLIKRKKQMEKKWDIELFSLLREVFGREITLSMKINYDYILLSRLSFKSKVAYEVINSFLPKKYEKNYGLDLSGTIKSLRFGGYIYYFTRHRDVLLFSNDKIFLEKSLQNIEKENFFTMKASYIPRKQNVSCYFDLETIKKKIEKEKYILQKIKEIGKSDILKTWLQYNYITSELSLKPQKIHIKNTIQPSPISNTAYTPNPLIAKLPQNTFSFTSTKINWKQEWEMYRQNIPRSLHNIRNLINQGILFLEKETLITLSSTDFEKTPLKPHDMFPALSIIIKAKKNHKLREILSRLKEIRFENQEIFIQETYANRKITRIKFPDVSGGAIRPAIAIIDGSLIITSHIAYIKSIIDVKDTIIPFLAKDDLYQNLDIEKNAKKHTFYIDINKLSQAIVELKPWLAENIALMLKSRRYKFYYIKRQTKLYIENISILLKAFRLGGSINIGSGQNGLEINWEHFIRPQ